MNSIRIHRFTWLREADGGEGGERGILQPLRLPNQAQIDIWIHHGGVMCDVCGCAACANVWRVRMCGVCECVACADVWRVRMCGVCGGAACTDVWRGAGAWRL